MMDTWIEKIGILSACAVPFFNIPLIQRLIERKSSEDLSLPWAIGVWTCFLLMTPQALRSQDVTFRLFGILNLSFFSIVAFLVVRYRLKPKKSPGGSSSA